MTKSGELCNRSPLEPSSPVGAAPLESILCTEELRRRPSRPPDYDKENRALVALVSALADSPGTILQTLADKVLGILEADSAGLSLLTKTRRGSTGRPLRVRGDRISVAVPRAILARAVTCSIATFPCCLLIGSDAIHIWARRRRLRTRDCLLPFT